MNHFSKSLILFLLTQFCYAQPSTEIDLWKGTIPNSVERSTYKELSFFQDSALVKLEKVSVPTLRIFNPKTPNGTAILVCPGGGYEHLSMDKEGYKLGKWLNDLGITAVVLKYRLPNDSIMKDKSIAPLQDVQAGLRYIRRYADSLKIKTDRIGVLGFSAGGHLAASLSTLYNKNVYSATDSISARPDFSILIYPVISMEEEITHQGSKRNLLGQVDSSSLVETFSNEKNVDSLTPKTFLIHATDDRAVPVENSIEYYRALISHKVPVEMHIFETGGHGFGLGRERTSLYWPAICERWLEANNLIGNITD